ncbi:hypothetical protein VNO78_08041 [Psophocarpus tetragonolobus]|uniref:Uncharacterized protein n=1 Tax=Psophocarpus tetragonolobus TaxID=3891 RepID=A0AAN9XS86_PSOTE
MPSIFFPPRPPLALSVARLPLDHLIALASLIHSHQNCSSLIASIWLPLSFALLVLRTPLLLLLIPISCSDRCQASYHGLHVPARDSSLPLLLPFPATQSKSVEAFASIDWYKILSKKKGTEFLMCYKDALLFRKQKGCYYESATRFLPLVAFGD